MELIAAVLFAGPLGYFAKSRKQGLILYLLLWAVIFPIQTIVVFNDSASSGDDWLYWAFNALFLAGGIGLNRLGAWFKERNTGPRPDQEGPVHASPQSPARSRSRPRVDRAAVGERQ